MKNYRDTVFRHNFTITHECKECGEKKPSMAFTVGKGSVCNVCLSRRRTTDQAFIDRKNRTIYEKEIREANKEYDWLS